MNKVNINTLVNDNHILDEYIPNDIIIIGKIDGLIIEYKYDRLDLSKIDCNVINYQNQEGESIKNHLLPNSLQKLHCYCNQLTSLPKLPNSLEILCCNNNQLTSLPKLPNSLKELYCAYNQLTSLHDKLPNSLNKLNFCGNRLTSLPKLPNSLEGLYCDHNQLTSLPDFSHIDHELELSFIQDLPISFIPYNKNIRLYSEEDNKINIEGYPHNPITNQDDLDQYMEYIKNYEMNRIKSARK